MHRVSSDVTETIMYLKNENKTKAQKHQQCNSSHIFVPIIKIKLLIF
jgi:hypothetical protein